MPAKACHVKIIILLCFQQFQTHLMCVSVLLVCNLVYSLSPLTYIMRSRNDTSVRKIVLVNLIDGYTVFKYPMNSNSESMP